MRHTSAALLRKVFGGINGDYWYNRLNFKEVDMYTNPMRGMSAMRTVSRQQRESKQSLESMLIALCTRLEQRLVKFELFCREISFFIRYLDGTGWDCKLKLADPVQDGMEIRRYILNQMEEFESSRATLLFNNKLRSMGVAITGLMSDNFYCHLTQFKK